MAKQYDATTKHLVQLDPAAWLQYVGLPPTGPARVLNVDLSTVTAEADEVIEVAAAEPWLAHLEFQTSHDPTLGVRLLRYNVLLHHRHEQPVQSVAVLLRPEAEGRSLTGRLEIGLPGRIPYLTFD